MPYYSEDNSSVPTHYLAKTTELYHDAYSKQFVGYHKDLFTDEENKYPIIPQKIYLESEKTGNVELFVYSRETKYSDFRTSLNIRAWEYRIGSHSRCLSLTGYTLIIIDNRIERWM
jgi:hypothetical protein